MAGDALAVLDGLMLHLCLGDLLLEIVVAFGAEFSIRFGEQLFVV